MSSKFTISDFNKRFSSDEKCLLELQRLRYPRCHCGKKLYRVKKRTCFACPDGHQVYPLAGTVFEKSRTSLVKWFYAMFLMTHTRSGVSAGALRREIGVTEKTSWRMFRQIRLLMTDSGEPLKGLVEVDEAYVGGKQKNQSYRKVGPKSIMFGMAQRNGDVYVRHLPYLHRHLVAITIAQNISDDAIIIHDEHTVYQGLHDDGYIHAGINHSMKTYVSRGVHTQNIDNFWSGYKRGVYGVYRHVSQKYAQHYANEYAWRYNHRHLEGMMFDRLLEVSARQAQPID